VLALRRPGGTFIRWPDSVRPAASRGPPVSAEAEAGLAVEARGVTKWFGETSALDEVDLLVGPGVVHGPQLKPVDHQGAGAPRS
jgi:hypothetical protein